ncbi:MAG TPA: ParB/RepB/Spo0J family partition protein [Candidatus Competibacter sp.]|nr:ParB/RepB/Spo0J family partition protein [Candidatus Competibacter sp.]
MARKASTPLTSVKRTRNSPYHIDFESLKAEVVTQAHALGKPHLITQLSLDQLHRGRFQPRSSVDDAALDELAASIRELGILEPLIVRPLAGEIDGYEILAGDRRWRAAQKAGIDRVPVIVHDVDDRTAAAIALVENLQREDLNPMEEAVALRCLMDNFNLTQVQVSELVGKSESTVSKSIGLLKLPEPVQRLLQSKSLEAGHGKVLLNLPLAEQLALAERAAEQGWSVRELERQKNRLIAKSRRSGRSPQDGRSSDIQYLEIRLREWLCTPVRLKPDRKGGGKIEISYASAAECESVLERFGFRIDDD